VDCVHRSPKKPTNAKALEGEGGLKRRKVEPNLGTYGRDFKVKTFF
jgi:hypothetical protein